MAKYIIAILAIFSVACSADVRDAPAASPPSQIETYCDGDIRYEYHVATGAEYEAACWYGCVEGECALDNYCDGDHLVMVTSDELVHRTCAAGCVTELGTESGAFCWPGE